MTGKFIKVWDLGGQTYSYIHILYIRKIYEPHTSLIECWKADKDCKAGTRSCIDYGDNTVYTTCGLDELADEIKITCRQGNNN